MPLDIALGIMIALGLARFSGVPADWPFVATGVFFALLPDADFIVARLRGKGRGRLAHEHRDLFHKPIGYLAVGGALLIAFGRGTFAPLFALASLAHFLHDMVGVGWGVKALWPFSDKLWKLFADGKTLVGWTPEEVRVRAEREGDDDWIARAYARLTPTALIEYAALIAAIIALAVVFG